MQLLAGFCLLTLAMAAAQAPAQIVSPEVHPDRTVTFRFKDVSAKVVQVAVEGSDAVNMTRGADGVWTYTTKPLVPDIYGYNFTSDAETRLDIHNPVTKPNLIWPSNAVLVPGTPPEAWELTNVSHGVLHHHFYHSDAIGDDRDYFVYTPPGYRSSGAAYPVLYLLHGYSDMASGWTAVGKANLILDNLIAAGKAKPMLIVMTLGYGVPDFASAGLRSFSDPNRTKRNYDLFTKALLTEVIPQVEQAYHASKNSRSRAIAGLSMGGAETLLTGLNHSDTFSYVGAFSSGGLDTDFAKDFPALDTAKVNKQLKLLSVSCGTEDGLITVNRNLVKWLRDKQVKVVAIETPGRHAWMVWRRNLIEFAKSIF
jgi:enterochelin esterase-like enzyme